MKSEILKRLEDDPTFRERKNKNLIIGKMVASKYKDSKDPKVWGEIVGDIHLADRYWRLILADPENKHLRGKDYSKKTELEQEFQLKHLEVEPGIEPVIKKVKQIVTPTGENSVRVEYK